MISWSRHISVLLIFLVVMALHGWMWYALVAKKGARRSRAWRAGVTLLAIGLVALVAGGLSLGFARVLAVLPPGRWIAWTRASALGWALFSVGLSVAVWLWQRAPGFDPTRRRMLQAAGVAAVAAPALAGGVGVFIARCRITGRTVDLKIQGLPPDLDGLRMAQLSDIHMGAFLSERELVHAVGIANEFKPHLALVTGDFVTERGDPLDLCLEHLSKLRASHGIFGCLGNHEGYIHAEAYTADKCRSLGIDILRNRLRWRRFGKVRMYIAGIDYQRMGGPYMTDTGVLTSEGNFSMLLSHNPDVFPVAASRGHQLVISGHTHGGQLNFEPFGRPFNIARFYTPYIYGTYRQGPAVLYVSRGIGTVVIPVRIGAPPEVSLIRLCAT